MGSAFHGVVLAMSLLACRDAPSEAGAVSGQLHALEVEQERQEARLDDTRRQIEAAERDLARARTRARFMACEATVAARDAAVNQRRAECSAANMRYGMCLAQVAREQSDATMMGVFAGAALAAVTGGAGALLAAGGGLAGHELSASAQARCRATPPCTEDPTTAEASVSAELGMPPGDACAERVPGYSSVGACDLTLHRSVHLRPEETLASRGPNLPAETVVSVVERGSQRRRTSRLFRVLAPDGATGWVFLDGHELGRSGCPWSIE